LIGHRSGASCMRLLLCNMAVWVSISVGVHGSAGLLFSPQRDPSIPWTFEEAWFTQEFAPREAIVGNMLAFIETIETEAIRVNSGLYARHVRRSHRRKLGVGGADDWAP
jgi:hypothetical protein